MFWAQLGPKIKLWSIYVPYLSPAPNERVEIESKDIVFKKSLKRPLTIK